MLMSAQLVGVWGITCKEFDFRGRGLPIHWLERVDVALSDGAAKNRPVLLDFSAPHT